AIIQTTEEDLFDSITRLIDNNQARQKLNVNSATLMSTLRGATQRSINDLHQLAPQFFVKRL
ncbi:MAG TPA: hypothetical protein VN457_01980, partial [Chlamydiales bacterium]|nr:hypothetical protein [Chlamydiales bacterium]